MAGHTGSDHTMTVAQVRAALADSPFEELPAFIERFACDERSQVAKLVATARHRLDRETRERERVGKMYSAMREFGGNGIVVGIDEVGRGPVAGPLTVCALALPDDPVVWGLNDSKQLSPASREALAEQIRSVALGIGIAHISPEQIDACGMAASLRLAFSRALADSNLDPNSVLIDGLPLHIHPHETAVVHGDAKIACIAAASIVAKVTRDAIMVEADALYPGYGLAQSKGYASPEHIAAIKERGLTPIHRASFCKNFL